MDERALDGMILEEMTVEKVEKEDLNRRGAGAGDKCFEARWWRREGNRIVRRGADKGIYTVSVGTIEA